MGDGEQAASIGLWILNFLDRINEFYFWAVDHQNHFAFFAAVFGIVGGAVAVYRIWLHWDRTRRKLFTAYLNEQENKILERKGSIASRLQSPSRSVTGIADLNVHADIDRALKLFDKGKLPEAELMLRNLHSKVDQRHDFAKRQAQVARTQISAVHLFLGSIMAAQHQPGDAIEELKKCLEDAPHDADALKYLGEQYLVLAGDEPENAEGHGENALQTGERLERVAERHSSDEKKLIQAEGLRLQGRAYAALGNGGNANEALQTAAEIADWANNHEVPVAEINDLLGDVALSLENWIIAEDAFGVSTTRFRRPVMSSARLWLDENDNVRLSRVRLIHRRHPIADYVRRC